MSGFNKVTSFILGLIVVLVFLFVFGSRINLSDKLIALRPDKTTPTPTPVRIIIPTPTPKKKGFFESIFGRKPSPTPTPTIKPTPTPTIIFTNTQPTPTHSTGSGQTGTTPKTIPSTGSPTILLPILVSALGSGLFLRKKN